MATKENLDHMVTKENLDHMATKENLDHMATKENLDHMVMQWAVISRVPPSVGDGHLWGRLM